ncbi:MAG: hypothetical protein OYH77_01915 [Pseudomonadota bacterium]|nr:hypothetical protein [Pseudomonadota bacterium]
MQPANLVAISVCFLLTIGCGWFKGDGSDKSTQPTAPATSPPSTTPAPAVTTTVTKQTNLTVFYSFSELTTDNKVNFKLTLKKDNTATPNVPYEVFVKCSHWGTAAVSWAKGVTDAEGKVSVSLDALFGKCTYELKLAGETVGKTQLTRGGKQLGGQHLWQTTDTVPSGTGCENIKAINVNVRFKIPPGIAYIDSVSETATYAAGNAVYLVNVADYVDGNCSFGDLPLYGNALKKDLDANLGKKLLRWFLVSETWGEDYTVNNTNATAAVTFSKNIITYHIPPPASP